MFRPLFRSVLFVVAVAGMIACNDNEITTPTVPTPDPVTETFGGAINPNGASTHTFSATTAGSVTATLSAVGPDSATVIGFLLGFWNGTSCSTVTANDAARQAAVLHGTATQAGQFCVRVYDVGRITANTTYEITVVHP